MVPIARFVRKEKKASTSVETTDPIVGSSPASVAEEFDMESRAETEAFSFTNLDKPWGAGGQCLCVDTLGHEKDPVEGNRWKAGEEDFNFCQVLFVGNDELELEFIILDPFGNHIGLKAGDLVFFCPNWIALGRGSGVGELGAD
jgi:hypothetical protein